MKQYKVLQNFIRKEDMSKVVYDFNFDWTTSKNVLNNQINKIKKELNEVTFKNGYSVQYDDKEPYTIIERDAQGFEVKGECFFELDEDGTILNIGNTNLIYEIGKNLNGVKLKVTVEVLE